MNKKQVFSSPEIIKECENWSGVTRLKEIDEQILKLEKEKQDIEQQAKDLLSDISLSLERIEFERPKKRDIFLLMACINAQLSADGQTKCGCVITSKPTSTRGQIILGCGYNSPVRGADNGKIPNIRPAKYPYMIHSEINGVNNCFTSPINLGGGIAYVTGNCCFGCFQHLINNGVNTIYQLQDFSNPKCVNEEDEQRKLYLIDNMEDKSPKIELYKVYKDRETVYYGVDHSFTNSGPGIGNIFRRSELIKLINLFLFKGFDYSNLETILNE